MPSYLRIGVDALRIEAPVPMIEELGLCLLEFGQRGMHYLHYPNKTAALFVPSPDPRELSGRLRNFVQKQRNRTDGTPYTVHLAIVEMPHIGLYPFTPSSITTLPRCEAAPSVDLLKSLNRHQGAPREFDLNNQPAHTWHRITDSCGDLQSELARRDIPHVSVPLANNRLTYMYVTRRFAQVVRADGFLVFSTGSHLFRHTYRRIQGLSVPQAPLIEFSDEQNTSEGRS